MIAPNPGWEWVASGIRHYTYASSLADWLRGKLHPIDRPRGMRSVSARYNDPNGVERCGIQVREEDASIARVLLLEGQTLVNPDYVIVWPEDAPNE
jgi:hypothetical protein